MPDIATHTYRDMPFPTTPVLWNRLAGGRRRKVPGVARAHGDGLTIDLETPEALEEVLWKLFWPEKYGIDGIGLWRPADRKPDAERFMQRHMAKIVRARHGAGDSDGRRLKYCAKNNANIARLPYLAQAFPGCRIVVPVRRPESHAASMLRQHRNFRGLQERDPFVARYMADIGHYEFGNIHRPIRFPGFEPGAHDADTVAYWLSYWVHAFREVLAHADLCLFVLQDDLRAAPNETMRGLARALDLELPQHDFRPHFRSVPDRHETLDVDSELQAGARELYDHLEALSYSRQTETRPAS